MKLNCHYFSSAFCVSVHSSSRFSSFSYSSFYFILFSFGLTTTTDPLTFTGLYVSRNTYIRAGVAEWKITKPVHIACLFLCAYRILFMFIDKSLWEMCDFQVVNGVAYLGLLSKLTHLRWCCFSNKEIRANI